MKNYKNLIQLVLAVVICILSSTALHAQWGFTATYTMSGKNCGNFNTSGMINGIPTKNDCESIRSMLLNINVSSDGCRIYYRCTACTGSDIAGAQQSSSFTPGKVTINGTETGQTIFSPNPGQSVKDWGDDFLQKMQSFGMGNAENNQMLPTTGNKGFDGAYADLMNKEDDGVVAYIGKSRVPIYKDPSQLIVTTQQDLPSLPAAATEAVTIKEMIRGETIEKQTIEANNDQDNWSDFGKDLSVFATDLSSTLLSKAPAFANKVGPYAIKGTLAAGITATALIKANQYVWEGVFEAFFDYTINGIHHDNILGNAWTKAKNDIGGGITSIATTMGAGAATTYSTRSYYRYGNISKTSGNAFIERSAKTGSNIMLGAEAAHLSYRLYNLTSKTFFTSNP